jgi:hypothetical protein
MDEKPASSPLPLAPPGFKTLPAPRGYQGYILAPDPETGSLLAVDVNRLLTVKLPEALKDAASRYQEMYKRFHFCQYHLSGPDGVMEITEETVATMRYPAELTEIVLWATAPLLEHLFSQKN